MLLQSVGYGQASDSKSHVGQVRFSRSSSDQKARFIAIDAREAREEEDESELESFRKQIESSKYITAFFYYLIPIKEEFTAFSKQVTSTSSQRLYLTLGVFRL
jgi:hypothetical protein